MCFVLTREATPCQALRCHLVAYQRDRAIRFRDLARRAGNFEDARYLLELATDADRQAEVHDQQAAPSEDLDFRGGPHPRRLD
jgi:hypothetical protein